MEILTAISVTVIAAIMVLGLIFMIPVLLQIRRTAREAEKLIDSVRVQVAPISRDIVLISRDVKSIVNPFIGRSIESRRGLKRCMIWRSGSKSFKSRFRRRIEEPLLQLVAVMGGIKRGLRLLLEFFTAE